MIYNKKEFFTGMAMLAAFFVVLALFFMPLYEGHNGLSYLDNLYNSISKYSANYLEETTRSATVYDGNVFEAQLPIKDAVLGERITTLFNANGAQATLNDEGLKVSGDLGAVFRAMLADCERAYNNDGQFARERYGLDTRTAIYTWWQAMTALEKRMKKQERFAVAKDVSVIITRGVEPAYNYYGVEAQSISSKLWVVIFSLAFYVAYTLWYGFAILFMFEGWGLKLEH